MARIFPPREQEWFEKNSMHRYLKKGNEEDNDPGNVLHLRADLQSLFYEGRFFFTKKCRRYVVHFNTTTVNLGAEFHNRTVSLPAEVHPCFVLCHIAWSVFPRLLPFLRSGEPRLVMVGGEARELSAAKLKRITEGTER